MIKKILIIAAEVIFSTVVAVQVYKNLKKDIMGKDEINLGDQVQWVSQGVCQFPSPKIVRKIVKSQHGTFILVEGSDTGLPIEQVEKVE